MVSVGGNDAVSTVNICKTRSCTRSRYGEVGGDDTSCSSVGCTEAGAASYVLSPAAVRVSTSDSEWSVAELVKGINMVTGRLVTDFRASPNSRLLAAVVLLVPRTVPGEVGVEMEALNG